MVEIRERRQLEKIEKVGDVKKYKSDSKSIRGLILGLIQKFSSDSKNNKIYSAKELQMIFSEVLSRFNELYPQKVTKIEVVEGWEKANGEYPIEKNFENDFIVEIWHNENKEKKIVSKADLNRMLNIIRKLEVGKVYNCYNIADLMGIEWGELWKHRMDIYFPRYYAPLKILSFLKIIDYGGNKKTIIRLK